MTNVPDSIKQQLALNPNSYVDLSAALQRNVAVALACIQNGVRAPLVVEEIMTQCPALQHHKVAWKLLIDSAVKPQVLGEFSREEITGDLTLMTKAIQNCGPRIFEYLQPKLHRDLALLTLERMTTLDYRIEFDNLQDFTCEIEALLKQIFRQVPELSESTGAWKLVVLILSTLDCSYYIDSLFVEVDFAAIWGMASPVILDNDEIMKLACHEISGDQLQFATARLQRDVSLIRALIVARDTDFMLHVPAEIFVKHPSLIVDFLVNDGNTGTVLDVLPAELWKNRKIVEIYLRMGGQPHDGMEETAGQDWNNCLAFIQGSTREQRRPLTSWICEDLRNDPAFLAEAAKLNKWVLQYANGDIRRNPFDILLVTAAYHGVHPLRTIQMMPRAVVNTEAVHIDLIQFADDVNEALHVRYLFSIVMCATSIDRAGCCLSMLNLGPDCLIVDHIARFLGVPFGEKLKHLRLALPVVEEFRQDPEGREFLADMGLELLESNHNVL